MAYRMLQGLKESSYTEVTTENFVLKGNVFSRLYLSLHNFKLYSRLLSKKNFKEPKRPKKKLGAQHLKC